MPFKFEDFDLFGPLLVTPRRFPDQRGWFGELYKQSAYSDAGITDVFVQDNISRSIRGVLRGLHFQPDPYEQAKLVTVLQGRIFDVAVDIRSDSPTYLRWVGVELSSDQGEALYIPAGFAHGFLVTSANATVMYKCSTEYHPEAEKGIIWNDRSIAINWPISNPIVSEKDSVLKPVKQLEREFQR